MKKNISIVDMAHEIIDMDDELNYLRGEVIRLKEYEKKYFQLLQDSTAHNHHMVLGMLDLAMKPGVMGAISNANKAARAGANQ